MRLVTPATDPRNHPEATIGLSVAVDDGSSGGSGNRLAAAADALARLDAHGLHRERLGALSC